MASNSLNQWSWSEILARHNKEGTQLLDEVNVLIQQNDMLQDAPVRESNLINGEEFTVTTSLPQPELHARGEGRAATKGQVQHGSEAVAWFTNQMRVNREELDAAPDPITFLRGEEMKYLEGMNQSLQEMMIYGSTADEPKEFDGLDIRYDSIAADSVIDNGGTTASHMTDIWFIQWDLQDCCMIYPKGEKGGIYRTPHPDTCLATLLDADDAVADAQKHVAWYTMVDWDWKGGICLRDPRRVKRLANIHQDVGNAKAFNIDNFFACEEAFETPGQIYAYMNKRVRLQVRTDVNVKSNVTYPPNQPFARPQAYIGEIPLRRCDRILLTGSQIT
jgi:hypothetical protein